MAKLFLSILNMSLTGAFVIAAICLVRLPLKKAPKLISYCLWAVAGFRLVVPYSVESVFSLIPFRTQPIPPDISMPSTPSAPPMDGGMLPSATPTASIHPWQVWTTVGAYVWLLGVVVLLLYGLVSYLLLKHRLHGATHIDGILYEADNLRTPFVLGVFKPKIYLPLGFSREENSYVILHEQIHIRRQDYRIKFAAYCVLCLHWFNPLVWVAFLLMEIDMELSCDEQVLKEMGGGIKKAYSLSLLSFATERRTIGGTPLAFGEGGIKERVNHVLNFKKPSKQMLALSIALVLLVSVGCSLNKVDTSLQAVTGLPKEVVDYVNFELTEYGFTYETAAPSVNSIAAKLGDDFKAYDLLTKGSTSYVLIIRSATDDFSALFDEKGELLLIDSMAMAELSLLGLDVPIGHIPRYIGTIEEKNVFMIDEEDVLYVDENGDGFRMTHAEYDAWDAAGRNKADIPAFALHFADK